jgi:hypothetical protein
VPGTTSSSGDSGAMNRGRDKRRADLRSRGSGDSNAGLPEKDGSVLVVEVGDGC